MNRTKKIVLGFVGGLMGLLLPATQFAHGDTLFEVWEGGTGIGSARQGELLTGSADHNITFTKVATGSAGQVLTMFGGLPTWLAPATSGTVTSVNMTVPTGLSISGNPITTSGTLALTLTSGFVIPLTASTSQWNTLQHLGPYLPLAGGTLTGNLIGTGASFSSGEFTSYASASKIYVGDGALGTPGLSFANDKDTGLYLAGANALGLVGGGAAVQWNGDALFPENNGSRGLGYSTNKWRDFFTTTASVSGAFEGNTASISGTFKGNSTGSNSFAGSLNVSKGLTANSYQGGGLSSCIGSNTLRYAGGQFSCSAITSTPGGSDTQLQFNNAGAFGGAVLDYTFDGTSALLKVEDQPAVDTNGYALTLNGSTGLGTANGGDLTLMAGNAGSTGNSGSLILSGGTNAGSGDGGSVIVKPQLGAHGGADGRFQIVDAGSDSTLTFDSSTTGGDQTYVLPANTGTLALTSDLAAYQPLSSILTTLSSYNTNGLFTQTSTGVFTGRTITGTANQLTVTNGNGVSGNPTLSIPTPFIMPGRASVSGNFEVLGTASISSNFNAFGTGSNSFAGSLNLSKSLTGTGITMTGGGSNSFSGSLNISKSITATNNITAALHIGSGTGSNSFAGSLELAKGLRLTGATGLITGSGTGSNSFAGSLNLSKSLTSTTNVTAALFQGTGAGSSSFAGSLNSTKGIHAATDISGVRTISINAGNADHLFSNTQNNDGRFTIRSVGGATTARLDIIGSASQNLMTIASNGNVGLGTNAPVGGLHLSRVLPVGIPSFIAGDTVTNTGGVSLAPTINQGIDGQSIISGQATVIPTTALNSMYGMLFLPTISGTNSNNITTLYNMYSRLDTAAGYTGTINSGLGYDAANPTKAGTAKITNYYGYYSEIVASGSNNFWGFYAQGTAPNYFGGNVGIKNTAPKVPLDVTGAASISGTFELSGLTAAAGTPNTLCQNSVSKEITVNTTTTCLVSARDQKLKIEPLTISALDLIEKLKPSQYAYKDNPDRLRWGFIADEVQAVDPRLGDAYLNGEARSLDIPALTTLNTKAIQELSQKNKDLEARIAKLEGSNGSIHKDNLPVRIWHFFRGIN